MPQDKRYRSGSAAAGGGMLTLWLTMRANAWLRQEWLSLLTETAAEGIGLVLQFLMLGIPLVVTIELRRRSAAQPCPLREGQNGSLWLVPAGLAVLLGANFLTLLLQDMLTGSGMSTPTPLPEEPLAIIFSMIGSILVPSVITFVVIPSVSEELLFRGAVLHALRPAGEKLAIWLSALLFMGAHGSLSQWLPALAAGLALGIVTFYTGTLRWAILIHLCNNIIAWVTTYFPSPLTAILLPVGLLILGGIALLRLRRMPRWAPARGNPRLGVSVPLVLALLLLLGNALFPVV